MTKPNISQSDNGSLKGTLDEYFREKALDQAGMLPCSVVDYDEAGKSVTVQIMIQMVDTDDQSISRATISNVPVFTLSAGGFLIHFPIKAGDRGWIKANDRDISLYMQSLSQAKPNSLRVKSFSDGVFYPDMTMAYSPLYSGSVNIQNKNGSVCVSVHDDKVMIDAPDTIINSNVEINGDLNVNGGSVKNNGKDIGENHAHIGVKSGNETTGGPV